MENTRRQPTNNIDKLLKIEIIWNNIDGHPRREKTTAINLGWKYCRYGVTGPPSPPNKALDFWVQRWQIWSVCQIVMRVICYLEKPMTANPSKFPLLHHTHKINSDKKEWHSATQQFWSAIYRSWLIWSEIAKVTEWIWETQSITVFI